MEFLYSVQESPLSAWIRESDWALFAGLIVHTISMGILLGTAAIMDLRIIGVAALGAPLSRFSRFRPILTWGLGVSIISGVVLVAGYPAKAVLNPLFYIKLVLLIAALVLTRNLARQTAGGDYDVEAAPARIKQLAWLSLVLLTLGLFAGKFLAHTAPVTLLQGPWLQEPL